MTGDTIIPVNGKQVQVVYGKFLGSVTFKRDSYLLPFHDFAFLT